MRPGEVSSFRQGPSRRFHAFDRQLGNKRADAVYAGMVVSSFGNDRAGVFPRLNVGLAMSELTLCTHMSVSFCVVIPGGVLPC